MNGKMCSESEDEFEFCNLIKFQLVYVDCMVAAAETTTITEVIMIIGIMMMMITIIIKMSRREMAITIYRR